MKILIVAPEEIPVPPFSGGSVENCIIHIAKRLALVNHVTILSRKHPRYPNYVKTGNLTIIRIPSTSRSQYIHSAMDQVKGHHYDLIQIDNRPSFVPVVRKNYPNTIISVFLHSLTFVSKPSTSRESARRRLSGADLIIGNSHSLANDLKALFPGLQSKIKHVLLGVDLHQFRPPTTQQRLNARKRYSLGRSFTIVYAGRLIPNKGIPVLIKAAKIVKRKLPSTRLLIAGNVGRKSYKQHLKKVAAAVKMPTNFIGQVRLKDMNKVYWMGNCSVCPTQKTEAFGLVNVEAMASGTPCIASALGGIPEIIQHQRNGLLVRKYRDPAAFAAQILKIAEHRSLAASLSKQARADVVRKFSWGQTASKLNKIYLARKR